jgi:plastocyanin
MIDALEMRRTLAGRLMKGGIIIGIPMPGLRAAKLAIVAASMLGVTGCSHTHVVGASRTVDVALTEYRLIPQDVRAVAGQLTIVVHNYGRLTHNLVVSLNGEQEGATPPLAPGDSAGLTLTLAPGTYSIVSTILSDQDLGAYGTLIVTR